MSSRTINKKKYEFLNPIIYTYRDFPVRKYNKMEIRLTEFEFKKFIDAKIDLKLSGRETIEKGILLSPCNDTPVVPIKSNYGKSDSCQ